MSEQVLAAQLVTWSEHLLEALLVAQLVTWSEHVMVALLVAQLVTWSEQVLEHSSESIMVESLAKDLDCL